MTNVRIEPWRIVRAGAVDDISETLFCVGNGRLSVRGFGAWQPKRQPQEHAVFRAGFFSRIKPGITDMVQLPDVLTLCPVGEQPQSVLQTLDMQKGVLTQAWETERAQFCMERTVSMADERLLMQRLTVTAKQDADFVIRAVQDACVANLPVHDDQTVRSSDLAVLLCVEELTEERMRLRTLAEGTEVELCWKLVCSRPCPRETHVDHHAAVTTFSVSLGAGESATIEKRVWVRQTGDEPPADSSDAWQASAARWKQLWRDCDIELDADDPQMQGALRYNLFQLLCNNAAGDPRVSIGARGLTHGRYKGNTFWDTDIFLLPFYLWTRPEAARNLLLYRIVRLDDARALAKKQNLEGARFPWMCSDSGMEQCESWDIGLCEVHVTADIAYAAQRYIEVTGDEKFLREHGAELYRETARYWRSRLTYEPSCDRYSSFFVKGPDEYCGAAINNTFTNYMARNNLRLALQYGQLNESEREETEFVDGRVTLLYDERRKLYLQDETLERLPPFPSKQGDAPSYKSVCFDRMQRYRALKQADLVLLMTLFPDDFTFEQKKAVFEAYEPITVHDSTLSYGVHALLALRLEKWDKAEEYLRKGVYLDLLNVMGNTGSEGVHMAALGAAWQAFVFGAAGLWTNGDQLTLHPKLPPFIRQMRFCVWHRNKRYRVQINHDGYTLAEEA